MPKRTYYSRRSVSLILELTAVTLSFILSVAIRYVYLIQRFGSRLDLKLYAIFLVGAVALYAGHFLIRRYVPLEKLSRKEILFATIQEQILYVASYIILFYFFPQAFVISRLVVGLFFILSILTITSFRVLYRKACIAKKRLAENPEIFRQKKHYTGVQHIYIIGAKSVGLYGGYESFVMNLLQEHEPDPLIKYHVACKANGQGYMELGKMPGAMPVNEEEFNYCNAHCFMIRVPEKLGPAQAIVYDLKALRWVCSHIERNQIPHPVVYILASRIGPFERHYRERIHKAGGVLYQNPDGHEHLRRKWPAPIRAYWKLSERYAVKNADLVVCDSKKIEEYIQEEYYSYVPATVFIPYGSDLTPSGMADTDPRYTSWLAGNDLRDGQFVISVGRFVKENNFDIMIREFMKSSLQMDFAIIATDDKKFSAELQQKYDFRSDPRIKFVGTVYDAALLSKIRERAVAYLHGHEVGGTNPSLLESMAKTRINLLYDVGFNREVAGDAALYWTKEEGSLSALLDSLGSIDAGAMGAMAKERMRSSYSWKSVADAYREIFRQ